MRKYYIVTAAALAICMIMPAAGLLTGTQAEVCAAEKTGDMSGTVEEIADQFGDPANDPFGYTSDTDRKKALKKAAKTLPAKVDTSGEENKYEYDPAGTAAIKEQLYQKRGVQIGYKVEP